MTQYLNRGNDSNIVAYETGADYIKVQFSSGRPYTYSYQSAGASNVEHMKKLAATGVGLNSFIMRNVKDCYEQ